MNKTVSILGCGWLGTRLAKKLIAENFLVKGSTTTEEKLQKLEETGITPFLIDLENDLLTNIEDFLACDYLVINIPPKIRKKGAKHHPEMIKKLTGLFTKQKPEKIIYISSTSVYPETGRRMHERDVTTIAKTANTALLETEDHLLNETGIPASIIRSGGIAGDDRIPGKKAAEKGTPVIPNQPVNLIHFEDLNEIIRLLIDSGKSGIYNACTQKHPLRINVYEANRKIFGFPRPNYQFTPVTPSFKMVTPRTLLQEFNFTFRFPDPEKFFSN